MRHRESEFDAESGSIMVLWVVILETPNQDGIVELFYINGLSAPDKIIGN
jgi:hypothetical protein